MLMVNDQPISCPPSLLRNFWNFILCVLGTTIISWWVPSLAAITWSCISLKWHTVASSTTASFSTNTDIYLNCCLGSLVWGGKVSQAQSLCRRSNIQADFGSIICWRLGAFFRRNRVWNPGLPGANTRRIWVIWSVVVIAASTSRSNLWWDRPSTTSDSVRYHKLSNKNWSTVYPIGT